MISIKLASNSKLPSIFACCPTFRFLTIPTPPSTTRAPLVVVVDCVVSSTSNLPAITPEPPMLRFFSTPIPPSTTNEPVSLLVLSVDPKILVSSPTNNFLTIPTPPSI